MIKSSDLLVFFKKINLSGRSRFAILSTHLIISTYHDTASPTIFQQKKIKDKDRSSESQNKRKRQNKDTFITRDSSDFEFAERKFNQRVNSIDEHEREQKRRRERSREPDDRERDDRERDDRKRDDRERNDRKRDDRDRERDQIIDETTDVDEVFSEMISLLQF
jgi:hypothetical protein